MLTGAEMLPLIVGQIESAASKEEVEDAETIDVVSEEPDAGVDESEAEKPIANADAPPADYELEADDAEKKKDAT